MVFFSDSNIIIRNNLKHLLMTSFKSFIFFSSLLLLLLLLLSFINPLHLYNNFSISFLLLYILKIIFIALFKTFSSFS